MIALTIQISEVKGVGYFCTVNSSDPHLTIWSGTEGPFDTTDDAYGKARELQDDLWLKRIETQPE